MKLRGKRQFIAGIIGGCFLSGVAVAVASIPDSSTGLISGCYSTRNGALRIIDLQAGRRCNTGESLLHWNQQGPQGPPGLQGLQGPEGPLGEQGLQGLPGNLNGRSMEFGAGIDNGEVASREFNNLPAGTYVAFVNGLSSDGNAQCQTFTFAASGGLFDSGRFFQGYGEDFEISSTSILFVPDQGTIRLECRALDPLADIVALRFAVTQLTTLTPEGN